MLPRRDVTVAPGKGPDEWADIRSLTVHRDEGTRGAAPLIVVVGAAFPQPPQREVLTVFRRIHPPFIEVVSRKRR